jgi:hypothetical protein
MDAADRNNILNARLTAGGISLITYLTEQSEQDPAAEERRVWADLEHRAQLDAIARGAQAQIEIAQQRNEMQAEIAQQRNDVQIAQAEAKAAQAKQKPQAPAEPPAGG